MLRRRRRYGGAKYSFETTNINAIVNATNTQQTVYTIVPEVTSYGKRKVKNFTISLCADNTDTPLLCCLVYVPQGTQASAINTAANTSTQTGELVASMYEPNQNVITSFVINAKDTNVTLRKSFLARNLDSGDKIQLIIKNYVVTQDDNIQVLGTISYAIKY